MAVSFQKDIKPYFTACYRQHMLFFCDLWSATEVQANWDDIDASVSSGRMPKSGCPEGVWDKPQRDRFLTDFAAWKADGYLP